MIPETFSYGTNHVLQTVTVTTYSALPDQGYWVICIHGGAWRDPIQTALTYLTPAASILTASEPYSSTTCTHLAGFASIDYRLSAHPDHPQDRNITSPKEYRDAVHPDHLSDVQAALAFLQRKYGFGDRYILVGHSAGATLAFQSVMGRFRGSGSSSVGEGGSVAMGPQAILGMAGIYDLRLLRDDHETITAYQQFIEGAFGSDEALWDEVSPATMVRDPQDGLVGGWTAGRLAVLAHSAEDELVNPRQQEVMGEALKSWVEASAASGTGPRRVELLPINGAHDDPWDKGKELARAIAFTLEKLLELQG
ncbi:arylformamidase [Aspergillus saccharolyticus JOP 1030-1]|uniref:Kynurenine formamidase n=1 Tax=Aspergillus saccharolyticus JOP 1030-1 TaxID=1450539 RepID=A0A318ZIM7_9EURO|nr:alpha/beta-hydrolase [Aspergillus saccharolyticus JOP 1030-1]PYH46194.1 alpha/beta-hydrolase [Aspergillus saccharolyticus JOP 1030-1]